MVFRVYRQTYSVGILICNEHREQCQGEGEQFPWSLVYTNEHIPLVYLYVMNTVNSVRVKENSFHGLWNIPTDIFCRYTHM